MKQLFENIRQSMKHRPVHDQGFVPIGLFLREYCRLTKDLAATTLTFSIERAGGYRETRTIQILSDERYQALTLLYVERLIKTILWIRGGYRIVIDGPDYIVKHLQDLYAHEGARGVDVEFLERSYGHVFEVISQTTDQIPATKNLTKQVGGHKGGCRIGFDAGGSVKKVVALLDDEVVYRDTAYWQPKEADSVDYLYQEILESLMKAKNHLPSVDSFGVSTAGIVIDRSIRVSSLIREIPKEQRDRVLSLFADLSMALGEIPYEVVNDGEVTALAGSAALNTHSLLGITMGTSQGGGYVDGKGHVTDWLNELCFVPVDINPNALIDEWSIDLGVGVSYFSQDAAIKLAISAGISLSGDTPSEQFREIRQLFDQGHAGVKEIFYDIGTYLGYTIPFYLEFYDAKTILLMGGVMTGAAGDIILEQARQVLQDEFPELAKQLKLETFSDEGLTLGLAIAAAGLTP